MLFRISFIYGLSAVFFIFFMKLTDCWRIIKNGEHRIVVIFDQIPKNGSFKKLLGESYCKLISFIVNTLACWFRLHQYFD